MKNLFRRIISSVTALAMTMTLVPLTTFAEEEFTSVSGGLAAVFGSAEADDSDLALGEYITQELLDGMGVSWFDYRTNAADILSENGYAIYCDLYAGIEDIAAGYVDTSAFDYSVVASEVSYSSSSEVEAAANEMLADINFYDVYNCLLSDMPYELYWHDKTQGYASSAYYTYDGTDLTVYGTIVFYVADDYMGADNTTLNELPEKVTTAIENMKSIVSKYAGKSDLTILEGYRDEICSLTKYNNEAATDEDMPYGDPWQLIYVFDGDPDTTVVCEGYSKAFKQLCDMTIFTKDIYCFLVDGNMTSSSVSGPHMWNIVQIDNEYYHADVTNCYTSSGTLVDGLFLDGVTYTSTENTIFNAATSAYGNIEYSFSGESLTMYPYEATHLSETSYTEVTVSSVSVAEATTEYSHGDYFDTSSLKLNVTYSDGTTETVSGDSDAAALITVEPDVLTVDTTSVTITYNGVETTYDVTVNPAVGVLEYYGDTQIEYGSTTVIGCIITVDGVQMEEGTSEFQVRDADGNVVWDANGYDVVSGVGSLNWYYQAAYEFDVYSVGVGTYEVWFKYSGYDYCAAMTDFAKIATIEIVQGTPTVSSVEVTSPETVYDGMDASDITLSCTAVSDEGTVDGAITLDAGQTLAVDTESYNWTFVPNDTTNYKNVTGEIEITVVEDAISNLEIKTAPTETSYVEGDSLNADGLVLTATYASGATREITYSDDNASLFSFNPETLSKGDTSVTISYGGKDVVVNGLTVKGELTADEFTFTAPTELIYDTTEKTAAVTAADGVTGIGAVTVIYYEGETKLNSAPVDAGTYTVAINVEAGDEYVAATNLSDPSWTFEIEKATPTIAPSLTSPSVVYDITSVDKLVISHGASTDGTIAIDGKVTLTSGTNTIPVIFTPADTDNYNTVEGTVTVNVIKDFITGISVKTNPTKTEYTATESFDPTGLVITTKYFSGNSSNVSYDGNERAFSFSEDELTVDVTSVTVTYAEKTADITGITVAPTVPEYTVPTGLEATYGDTLADVVLPTGWSWDNVLDSVGNVGTFTSNATYDTADPNYSTVSEVLSVTVSPRTISLNGATVNDREYDGTTNAVVTNVTFNGLINGDTMVIDRDYTAVASFSDKNAGKDKTVTVTVTLINGNYVLDSNTVKTTAEIYKAEPNVTIPTTASAITNLPLSNAELPDGWVWDDETVIPVDGNTYTATYTPDDTTNYNVLTATVIVSVSDCTHTKTSETVVDATCTTDGTKTVICDICSEKVSTETIPAAHSWDSDYTVDVPATCTTDGTKSVHCANCSEIKPDSEVTIPASHSWNTNYSYNENIHWIECAGCDATTSTGTHTGGIATTTSKAICVVCGGSYGSLASAPAASKPYTPVVSAPQIKDDNGVTGWNAIFNELEQTQDGDTVVVDMNGTTKLPKAILENIEGRNIDLVLDMGNGISWTINGDTVTEPKNVDLRVSKNVKRIPVDVIDNVTGDSFTTEISLAHNGEFGFEAMLTISLGRKYNDFFANLYHYNRSAKTMEFVDSDLISNGEAQLIFNHASDYAIVIDEEALGDDVSSAAGITADSEAMETEAAPTCVVFALPLVLAAGVVLRKKLCK